MCDQVSQDFLEDVVSKKGSDHMWICSIIHLAKGDTLRSISMARKKLICQDASGFVQGDPLSPLLFNLVVDALTTLLERVKTTCHIEGVTYHLVQCGISTHEYVDDSLMLIKKTH